MLGRAVRNLDGVDIILLYAKDTKEEFLILDYLNSFKEKKVIYCNLEWIPLYENLPLSPDVLLSDMIKAFHPELLPDYHPVFYSLLEKE